MAGTLKSDGNLPRATLYIVLSALSFALAGTVIKLLSDALPTVTLVFWRNLFSFAALMLWFRWVGFPELRTGATTADAGAPATEAGRAATPAKRKATAAKRGKAAPAQKLTLRAGTKQAQMIEMLKRPKGATVEQIAAATGWQHHTIRGAISGALKKKLGLTVEATRTREVGPNKIGAKGSRTVYRIVS
jgi:Protein of unknown function (DUF3489)